MKFMVLDTNILLLDANNLITLGSSGDTVVLSDVVLGEIDGKKSGFAEINYQARQVGRLLAGAKLGKIEKTDVWTTTELFIANGAMNSVRVLVVSLAEYKANRQDSSYNDKRIIEVAKVLATKYRGVVFMTNDVLARLSALADGVEVTEFKVTGDTVLTFTKTLEIDDEEVFRGLHNSDIYTVDKEYVVGVYSYKFVSKTTGVMKLGTVYNGFISIIGRDTEKILRDQMAAPINAEQLLAAKAIQDPMIDLVIMEGKAGSGKNIVAFSNAIQLMKTSRGKYTSIVYMRTPQNDESPGEDIGYLSGNEEKYGVYLGPVADTLDFLVRANTDKKQFTRAQLEERIEERIIKLTADYGIESKITTGERGRTHHNTILILDEWGSASTATTQKMLTRVGKDCKVIVMGSLNQIDNKFVNRWNNGLAILLDEAYNRKLDTDVKMFAITLDKVVRSEMVEFAEALFSK